MNDFLDGDQFPDRPDHPDFWHLSEVVLQNDDASSDTSIPEIIGEFIDFDSLYYMAKNRAERNLIVSGQDPNNPVALAAAISFVFDGFVMGARFQKRYGKDDEKK